MQSKANRSCRMAATIVASLIVCHFDLAAGEARRLDINMVNIPAGSFLMGNCVAKNKRSAESMDCDPEANITETPRHQVFISAFQLSRTPVTVAQFKQFIAAAGRTDLLSNGEFEKWNNQGDDAPVLMINWDDSQDFIDWLNKADGGGWRLPSEAEWEYACRAGKNTRYCGSDDSNAVAWIGRNSDGHQHPVGQKQPNAWGLYDMNGNSYVWLQDCVHADYSGAPADGRAWTSDCTADYRMVRGGSFDSYASYARVTYRSYFWSDFRNTRIGLRLARSK